VQVNYAAISKSKFTTVCFSVVKPKKIMDSMFMMEITFKFIVPIHVISVVSFKL